MWFSWESREFVPHSEKSVFKSYRRAFQKIKEEGFETAVKDAVGRILGHTYDEFYYKRHSKYRLPLVKSKKRTYSGFNMGAGENALFEIFSIIHACPGTLLLVIDEVELGLHEEAQIRLIQELKELCRERHIQIIFTTHSPRVLECLPPEGRIHLERDGDTVRAMPDISPKYAAGLMSGVKQPELNIYCEDGIAGNILLSALPNDIRGRVRVTPIGSSSAVIRQLVSRFKEGRDPDACGILDGDQVLRKQQHINLFIKTLETVKDATATTQWIENRIEFLPGDSSPEAWLLKSFIARPSENAAAELRVSNAQLIAYIEEALRAGTHNELFLLSEKLNLPTTSIQGCLINVALENNQRGATALTNFIKGFLK
jgi:hypothetical protein